jgi:hypothetical protein
MICEWSLPFRRRIYCFWAVGVYETECVETVKAVLQLVSGHWSRTDIRFGTEWIAS